MKYGTKIRKIIKEELKCGQNEYADKKGVARSTMSAWVNAEYPPLELIEMVCADLGEPLYKFFMSEQDFKDLIGVDPQWLMIAKLVEQMPDDVQIKIMANILQIIEMIEVTLGQYRKNMEQNLESRKKN